MEVDPEVAASVSIWDIEDDDFTRYTNCDQVQQLETMLLNVGTLNSYPIHLRRRMIELGSWTPDCHQVYPNIFISDASTARDKDYLKSISLTHLVNAAESRSADKKSTETNAEYYADTQPLIKYMGIKAIDRSYFPMIKYFHEVADFIDEAIMSGGKVLVHCREGISRSTTLVIAYLMIKRCLSVEDALLHVKKIRNVRPNRGFLAQLIYLGQLLKLSYE